MLLINGMKESELIRTGIEMKSDFNPYEAIKKAGQQSRSGKAAGVKARADGRNTNHLKSHDTKKYSGPTPEQIIARQRKDKLEAHLHALEDAAIEADSKWDFT